MKSEVIFEIDQEILDGIKKTVADKSFVEVGIIDRSASVKGAPSKLAAIHEFGARVPVTPKMRGWFAYWFGVALRQSTTHIVIPPRSFMRKTMAQKAEDFIGWMKHRDEEMLAYVVTGQKKMLLGEWGHRWLEYLRECFDTRGFGQWKPLSNLTVWDKGSDEPLVRTGRLRGALSYDVVDKGDK